MGSSLSSYWLISGNLIMQDFHSFKFDEMFYSMHLFLNLYVHSDWLYFHCGFIMKQSFCRRYFQGINELGLCGVSQASYK